MGKPLFLILKDDGEMYLKRIVSHDGIRDTIGEDAAFSDCLSEDGRNALRAQLKLSNKALEHSVNTGNMKVARRRFEDMKKWVQTLDISYTKEAF